MTTLTTKEIDAALANKTVDTTKDGGEKLAECSHRHNQFEEIDQELGTIVKTVKAGDDEWEERLQRWNLFTERTDVRIIAVPKDTADVIEIVNWARRHEQGGGSIASIGVRSGGHGFFSAAAVVIDLRDGFDYTRVDTDAGIATVGMGQTLRAVDERTAPIHVPLGSVSHTGCGLMLTGGVGYLCKAHGTTADNITEVTIVTSDGTAHVCSAAQEPDLFFAVRGAAPNLGIVTEVKARCYHVPDALCTLRVWPCTKDNLKRLTEWSDQDAVLNDPTITPYIALLPSPDMTAHMVGIHIVCIGPAARDGEYKALIGQLEGTEGDVPVLPTSRVPYSTPQTIFDDTFPRQYWYVTQQYFAGDCKLPPEGLDDIVEHFLTMPLGTISPLIVLEQRGSTITSKFHEAPSDACAQPRFGQRWESYIFLGTSDLDHAETMRAEGIGLKGVVSRHTSAAGRFRLTEDDEPARVDFYYGPNSDRVRDVVAKYDPVHLFTNCNGMEFRA